MAMFDNVYKMHPYGLTVDFLWTWPDEFLSDFTVRTHFETDRLASHCGLSIDSRQHANAKDRRSPSVFEFRIAEPG